MTKPFNAVARRSMYDVLAEERDGPHEIRRLLHTNDASNARQIRRHALALRGCGDALGRAATHGVRLAVGRVTH
jgi:hypothetical protein